MSGDLKFEFAFGNAPLAERREETSPLRILVLGSLSGSAADPDADLARRPVMGLDLDNFDRTLARLSPSVRVHADDAASITVEFEALEDFHPDGLFRRVAPFRALREMRARLLDPATFPAAAAQLRPNAGGDAETIDRLLGGKPAPATSSATSRTALNAEALVRRLVAPHVDARAESPFRQQYLAALDAAASEQMRALLHQTDCQALEATWRGLRMLTENLDLDDAVRLEIVDVTREELRADLERHRDSLDRSGLHRLLAARSRGADAGAYSLLVGLFSFGTGESDVALLAALGAIAAHVGAPFLAAADSSVVGCRSLVESPAAEDWAVAGEAAQRWRALRASACARWIGLALPRVLLRVPYGKRTDPIETFEFEELAVPGEHERLLWGSPALACALLIGQAFMERRWDMEPGDVLEIGDLPAFTFEQDGEKRLYPCAEALLSERAAQAVLDKGVMPLLSFRNRNAVRAMRFTSIAQPATPLPVSSRPDARWS